MTKQFGTGNEPFSAPNVDIAKGDPEELIRATNQAMNTFYQTGKSIVETAGNTLTPSDGTNENPAQVGESVVKIAREQIGAYITTTGTAGLYSATLNPAPSSIAVGLCLCVVFNTASVGAATLNVNGFGAKQIKTVDTSSGTKISPNIISSNYPYFLVYDGVSFVLANDQLKGDADTGYSFASSSGIVSGDVTGVVTFIDKTFPYDGKVLVFSNYNASSQNASSAQVQNRIFVAGTLQSTESTLASSTATYTFNVLAGQTLRMLAQALNTGTTTTTPLSLRLSYIYIGGLS